ncbi:MAG: hypothetical protein GXP32_05600 [Kiritimatiellaeota bacterium]|nr:hypothetical protein [Kiritimatiellota bacterium]
MSRKLFYHSLALGILLCSSVSVSAQQAALFRDLKITPRWVYDPGFSSGTVINRGTKTQLKWLELDVSYTAVPMKRKNWLDDLTIEYRILLPKSGKRQVILSGKVDYWAIAMDGETHHAQAFVHPRFLQRYAPGLKLKKRELRDIRITVTFIQNESVVGKGVYKPKQNMSVSSLDKDLRRAMSSRSTIKVNHSVFSRDETPWSIINLNYYELIKRKK